MNDRALPSRPCALGAFVFVVGLAACDKGEDKPATSAAEAEPAAQAKTKAGDESETKPPQEEQAQSPVERCPEGAVLIQGGKFFMGSDSEDPILGRAKPAHQVEIGAVCIDVHEVSVSEYKTCVGAGECKPAFRESWWPQGKSDEDTWKHDKKVHSVMCNDGHTDRLNHPVNCVAWAQALAYCSYKDGRLPTEAEWEYAARGSDGRVYPWGDEVPDPERANACDQRCQKWRTDNELPEYGAMFDADDGYPGTAPVGSYPKGRTQGGLEDMVGNVFEWTADRFYTYGSEFQKDPKGPAEGETRVIRGGAFNSFKATFADPAFRFSMDESAYTHGIGFRCAHNPR